MYIICDWIYDPNSRIGKDHNLMIKKITMINFNDLLSYAGAQYRKKYCFKLEEPFSHISSLKYLKLL